MIIPSTRSDATPHAIFTPRHVPLPLRQQVTDELNRMEADGVISKVSQPTPWRAGMLLSPRKMAKCAFTLTLSH